MITLSDLALIASAFKPPHLYQELRRVVRDEDWKSNNGFRHANVADYDVAGHVRDGRFPMDGVAIELIEVIGDILPRVHKERDSVALVLHLYGGAPEYWYAYRQSWYPVAAGDLLVIPRGVAHGFRLGELRAVPFYLLVVTGPPLGADDTIRL